MDRGVLKSIQNEVEAVVVKLFSVIRYRFLLFAGLFPYVLGALVAFDYTGVFEPFYFLVGFLGIALVLVGVEALNEYFDFKIGGDRVFLSPERKIPHRYLKIGLLTFAFAFFAALYLTFMRGLPIMIFTIIGGVSAIFYLAPPIQLSYKGLGEIIIFLNYGPLITMGSYYLQARRMDFIAVTASLVPGFLILALSLINEIPDYHGDKLVGKKNIVVRLGRKRTVVLYGIMVFLCFLVLALFIVDRFSVILLIAFLTLPIAYKNLLVAKRHYETPKAFVPAIRGTLLLYTVVMSLFIISFV